MRTMIRSGDLIIQNGYVGSQSGAHVQAQDLINIVVLGPMTSSNVVLQLTNGDTTTDFNVKPGRLNMFTQPFQPGKVSFELLQKHKLMVSGQGLPIAADTERYNFNFWTGVW